MHCTFVFFIGFAVMASLSYGGQTVFCLWDEIKSQDDHGEHLVRCGRALCGRRV